MTSKLPFVVTCDLCDREIDEWELECGMAPVDPVCKAPDGLMEILCRCSTCAGQTLLCDGGEA
jgi:hypothetical protein